MYKWNLDNLYQSLNDPKFIEDSKALEQLIQELHTLATNFTTSNPVNTIKTYILKLEVFYNLVLKLQNFVSLNIEADSTSKSFNDAMVVIRQKVIKITLPNILFNKYVSSIENLDTIINNDSLLKEYSFYLKEIKKNSIHQLSDEEEVLAAELNQSGGQLFTKMQRYLTSTHEVRYEDKKLPLSVIRNMAYDSSQEVRRKAYEAELKSYKTIAKPLSFAINGIKKEVITISRKRNYESPLTRTLDTSRITQEVLDSLLTAIRESLPEFHKYLRKKGEYLGYEDGLPFYEIFAPIGLSTKKYTVEEAQDFILKNFKTFSEDLYDLAKLAFDERWIDYLPRPGKSGGAFCARIFPTKESRILTNFDGSISDISTLAHELGHAYHNKHIFNERVLNADYPMPIAETASILCETIVKNSSLKESKTNKEKLGLIEQELQDSTQVIVDILSRFIFESNVFNRIEQEFLDEDKLNQLMIEAQKQAYGDGLNHNFLNAGMWINKSHYYSTTRSYYNFPYAFGLLFANGIYALYQQKGSAFVTDIQKLLRLSGKANLIDAAKSINIDIASVDFWKTSLSVITKKIQTFIELINEAN